MSITQKQLFTAVRALGCSIKKVEDQYRVNLRGGSEKTAYYADDADDALETAKQMVCRAQGWPAHVAKRFQPEPVVVVPGPVMVRHQCRNTVNFLEPVGYTQLVRHFESEGLTTSDAQGCADAKFQSPVFTSQFAHYLGKGYDAYTSEYMASADVRLAAHGKSYLSVDQQKAVQS